MKKLYLFLILVLVYSLLAVAMNNKISKEKLEGNWTVKVTNAPNGYRDYIVDIRKNKGEYKADIFFVDLKHKVSDRTLTLEDGKLTGNVNVDREKMDITIWEDKGVVQGMVKSPSVGSLSVVFTRSK